MAELHPTPSHHSPPALPHPALPATRGQQDSLGTPKNEDWSTLPLPHPPTAHLQPRPHPATTARPRHPPPCRGREGKARGPRTSVPSSTKPQSPPAGPYTAFGALPAGRSRAVPPAPAPPLATPGPPAEARGRHFVCVYRVLGGGSPLSAVPRLPLAIKGGFGDLSPFSSAHLGSPRGRHRPAPPVRADWPCPGSATASGLSGFRDGGAGAGQGAGVLQMAGRGRESRAGRGRLAGARCLLVPSAGAKRSAGVQGEPHPRGVFL